MLEWILDPYNLFFWILVSSIIVVIIGLIFRPFLTHVKFAYPNALFEAMGNPYITDKELSSIVESKNLDTFKETINSIKDYNVAGEDTYSLQKSLDDTFIETVEMMRNNSSKKLNDFFDAYLERVDIYLVKNQLKKKIEGKVIEEGILDEAVLPSTKELLQKVMDVEKGELSTILKDYGFEQELMDALSGEPVDFLTVDTAIDKHVINRFQQVKVPYKCEQATNNFIKIMIDIRNIKNLLRAKQLGYDVESCKKLSIGEGREIASWKFNEMTEVDSVSQVISSLEGTSYYDVLKDSIEQYNKEDSVQILETALDGLFLKRVRDISMQSYISIGPTIRFLVSKEFELKNLKIIAKGVDENLSSDIIKNFLVTEAA